MDTTDHPAFVQPDEGIDETSPVENGEVGLFELVSESDRTTLARWADSIIPGYDAVALNARVRVGDLVMHRPGSIGFEIFTRSENVNYERVQARLAILQYANDLDKAKELDAWVHGDFRAAE